MRSIRMVIASVLLTVLLGVAGHAATVAWYRFEEGSIGAVASGSGSVLDSSGNGLHGTPIGTNGPIYSAGIAPLSPLCVALDGVDDWVYIPDNAKLALTESVTLEAFIKIDAFTDDGVSNFIVFRGDTRDGFDAYAIVLKPSTQKLQFHVDGPDSPTSVEALDVPFTWLGQTIHVAGVLNDATGFMGLYVDGELVASTTTSVRPRADLDPTKQPGVGIGNFFAPGAGSYQVDGRIDEVRISDRALKPKDFLNYYPPVLSYIKSTGYDGVDGLEPNHGIANYTVYKFKVRLTDLDGDEPSRVRLWLRRNGKQWRKSDMIPGATTTLAGRKYVRNMRLPAGNWEYCFEAKDHDGQATGPPTQWLYGPAIASRPHLEWAGTPGHETDGVSPDTGDADATQFTYKVKYVDVDGDMPTMVKVRILRDGLTYKKVAMTTADPSPDPATGIIYRYKTSLPPGTYKYRFLAADDDGSANGPAREEMVGPTLDGGSGTLQVTGLTAAPTARGAQVTFSLSASATVDARVVNIAGRPVATLCRERGCDAGSSTLIWNAMSDRGLSVPAGPYLVELTARADDGSIARSMTRVDIRR